MVINTPSEQVASDATSIDLTESYELIYWTARLGCTSRQLREAVRAAGPRVRDVVAWLRVQEGR